MKMLKLIVLNLVVLILYSAEESNSFLSRKDIQENLRKIDQLYKELPIKDTSKVMGNLECSITSALRELEKTKKNIQLEYMRYND